jgi:hypothetical protein
MLIPAGKILFHSCGVCGFKKSVIDFFRGWRIIEI